MSKPPSGLGYQLAVPPQIRHRHLLVLVHGISSRPATLLKHFGKIARRNGIVLLAPDFSGEAFRGYQRLGAGTRRDGAAEMLTQTACHTARSLGLDAERFDLAGYSGGAQFAHRYAMTRPGSVRSLTLGAAGWYSEASLDLPFPQGLGGRARAEALRAFLALPIHLAVGSDDRQSDASLRRSPELDARQGCNRLERARFWADHLCRTAAEQGIEARIRLSEMPSAGHSLAEAVALGRFDRLLAETVLHFAAEPAGPAPVLHRVAG